ncbi:MAG: GGDEF domain-containing protein [Candidatus Thiodiazotropha sp. (ex Monitilora ramsayi)]|nr:GGDEF domain-containing protein [Candidatus Thiodiazotropha sp. (ex Monitilora ramsayi)]
MELSGKLQTTLDLESLMELFAQVMQSQFDYDTLRYQTADQELTLKFGKRAGRNKLNYDLSVLDTDLGAISLSRGRKFREPEIQQIENLLAALLYPLRNALLYRDAIKSAFIDSLTGVKNRTAFDSNFSREIEYNHRKESDLSLIVLDIDLFKRVNDNYGHIIGDDVLKQVAQNIEETIRSSDALYRYGGEEFAIILNGTDMSGATLLAERIRKNVASMKLTSLDKDDQVTLSLGVATLNPQEDSSNLFERADAALYEAKDSGRNRVVSAA